VSAPRTDLELIPVRWSGLSNTLSLASLGLLIWGASAQVVRLNTGVGRPTGFVLLAAAVVSWVVAMVIRRDDTAVSGVGIGLMALAGGALVAFAPIAMVFPAVAVFGAAVRWRIQVGAVVAVAGWLAMLVAEVAVGPSPGVILGCLAAILGGALVGIARRQAVERSEQVARTEVETVRAEVERERAQLLSERNHLAREIHDVLAHTLAALSLQLEAFGTVVEAEPGRAVPFVNSSTGRAGSSTMASRRLAGRCRPCGTTRRRSTTSCGDCASNMAPSSPFQDGPSRSRPR
jgi:signal transduction histidine kinase